MLFDVKKKALRAVKGPLGIVNARLDMLPVHFTIKNGDIELPAKLIRTPLREMPHQFIYRLEYDGPDRDCYEYLRPFIVDFKDSNGLINDDVSIQNFHKTFTYSGKQVICTILKFLKVIGVKVARLYDASSVGPNYLSLSLVKLIEKGDTFYASFGFEYDFSHDLVRVFGTRENMDAKFREAYNKVVSLKISDIVRYHQRLVRILADVLHQEKEDEINLEENPVVGRSVIRYLLTGGSRDGTQLRYLTLVELLKESCAILYLLAHGDPRDKTLKDLILYAGKHRLTSNLETLTNFDKFPELIITTDGKKLKGTYLHSLKTLAALSYGYRTIDLVKSRLDACG